MTCSFQASNGGPSTVARARRSRSSARRGPSSTWWGPTSEGSRSPSATTRASPTGPSTAWNPGHWGSSTLGNAKELELVGSASDNLHIFSLLLTFQSTVQKNSAASRIGARFIVVVGKDADHFTATTAHGLANNNLRKGWEVKEDPIHVWHFCQVLGPVLQQLGLRECPISVSPSQPRIKQKHLHSN